jgi:hypothetical protein
MKASRRTKLGSSDRSVGSDPISPCMSGPPFKILCLPCVRAPLCMSSPTRQIELRECFGAFSKEERLTDADQWNCPKCKVCNRTASCKELMRHVASLVDLSLSSPALHASSCIHFAFRVDSKPPRLLTCGRTRPGWYVCACASARVRVRLRLRLRVRLHACRCSSASLTL